MKKMEKQKKKVIELDRNNKGTIRIGNQESVNLKVVARDELAQISIDGSIAKPKESTKEIITTEETTSVPITSNRTRWNNRKL